MSKQIDITLDYPRSPATAPKIGRGILSLLLAVGAWLWFGLMKKIEDKMYSQFPPHWAAILLAHLAVIPAAICALRVGQDAYRWPASERAGARFIYSDFFCNGATFALLWDIIR